MLAWAQGDNAEARRLLTESVPLFRAVGDQWKAALAHYHLGNVALISGDYVGARAHFDQSLVLVQEIDHPWGPGHALEGLGRVALQEGDYDAARGAGGQPDDPTAGG